MFIDLKYSFFKNDRSKDVCSISCMRIYSDLIFSLLSIFFFIIRTMLESAFQELQLSLYNIYFNQVRMTWKSMQIVYIFKERFDEMSRLRALYSIRKRDRRASRSLFFFFFFFFFFWLSTSINDVDDFQDFLLLLFLSFYVNKRRRSSSRWATRSSRQTSSLIWAAWSHHTTLMRWVLCSSYLI